MGATGTAGKCFLVFNFIFWLVGFAVMGYGIWILITSGNTSSFVSGNLIWTYAFLGLGLIISLAGLLGCIAGCAESTCCFKSYISLMVFILLLDIAVVAVVGYVDKDSVFDTLTKLWDEINSDTKDKIQSELGCCGYSGSAEYENDIPSSCYDSDNNVHTRSCRAAMQSWVEDNIPIWAAIIGSVGLLQIVASILSCVVLGRVKKTMRVEDIGE